MRVFDTSAMSPAKLPSIRVSVRTPSGPGEHHFGVLPADS
jgi:hypothetical protein